jgi:serine/threonine protein kinase
MGRLNEDDQFFDLLIKMVELNPKLRITPRELVEHSFLA